MQTTGVAEDFVEAQSATGRRQWETVDTLSVNVGHEPIRSLRRASFDDGYAMPESSRRSPPWGNETASETANGCFSASGCFSADKSRASATADAAIDLEQGDEVTVGNVVVFPASLLCGVPDRRLVRVTPQRDAVDDDVVLVGNVDEVVNRVHRVRTGRFRFVGMAVRHQHDDLFHFCAIGKRPLLRNQLFNGNTQSTGNIRCGRIQIWTQLRNPQSDRIEIVIQWTLKISREIGLVSTTVATAVAVAAASVPTLIIVAVVSTTVPALIVVAIVSTTTVSASLVSALVSATTVLVAGSISVAVVVSLPSLIAAVRVVLSYSAILISESPAHGSAEHSVPVSIIATGIVLVSTVVLIPIAGIVVAGSNLHRRLICLWQNRC